MHSTFFRWFDSVLLVEESSWQHYLKNFVSDLRQVGVFFPSTPVTSTNATARHDMTEIALPYTKSQLFDLTP
jgi:hypothetical protein